jgi:predicted deacetylase
MTARYLLRLDDACETMDHGRWDAIEALLDRLGIRPIVGITPDNRDPDLVRGHVDPAFWDRVRRWQVKGWSIAMHGLHHRLHHIERGAQYIPFHSRSEFAGLDEAAQAALVARAWGLFEARDVRPSIWMAPAHSFDECTLRAIRRETPIRVISDGLARNYFHEGEFTWLPQQLWWPRPRASGLWTICLHPNGMSDGEIAELATLLEAPYYRHRMVAASQLELGRRHRNLFDRVYGTYFLARGRAFRFLMPLYQAARRLWRKGAAA